MKKLIKNGTIVTDSQVFRADLLIEDREDPPDRRKPGYE